MSNLSLVLLFISLIFSIIYNVVLKIRKIKIVQINTANEQINKDLESSIANKKEELESIQNQLGTQKNLVNDLTNNIYKMQQDAQRIASERAQSTYDTKLEELNRLYQERELAAKTSLNIVEKKVEQENEKLKALEDKQLAYIQAQQRQKEIEDNNDYYRLAIDNVSLGDIKLLRELQSRFSKKDVIDKIIWESYYKPAYDMLMPRIIKDSSKVCGIYKITDLISGQAYIGQSVKYRPVKNFT